MTHNHYFTLFNQPKSIIQTTYFWHELAFGCDFQNSSSLFHIILFNEIHAFFTLTSRFSLILVFLFFQPIYLHVHLMQFLISLKNSVEFRICLKVDSNKEITKEKKNIKNEFYMLNMFHLMQFR